MKASILMAKKRRESMQEDKRAGLSNREIGEKYGVARRTVENATAGIKQQKPGLARPPMASLDIKSAQAFARKYAMQEDKRAGLSNREIGEKYGVSPATAARYTVGWGRTNSRRDAIKAAAQRYEERRDLRRIAVALELAKCKILYTVEVRGEVAGTFDDFDKATRECAKHFGAVVRASNGAVLAKSPVKK